MHGTTRRGWFPRRGDASVVREGAAKADISAEFAMSPEARGWMSEQEFDTEEDSILLRRVIDNAGRSKAFINGVAATASQLRDLGEMLVDIHGQHAHQSLLKTDAQRAIQFTRSAPGVDVALVGMKRVEHVEENLKLREVPPLAAERFASFFSKE